MLLTAGALLPLCQNMDSPPNMGLWMKMVLLEKYNIPSSLASCQKQLVPVSFYQYMLLWISSPHCLDWSQPAPSDAYSLYPSSSS